MSNIRLNHMFRKEMNFRELGGYRSQNGQHIKEGIFYRCAALSEMNEEELRHIQELGIKVIIDLRSHDEVKEHPDPEISGITNIHISAMRDSEGKDIDFSPQSIIKIALKKRERNVAESTIDRFYDFLIFHNTAYQKLFALLLDKQVPILFHCTAGKDRTGVAAILIMLALGVSEETIEKDYLLTNKYRHNLIVKKHKAYRLLGLFSKNMRTLLTFSEGVLPHGCDFVFEEIKSHYDSYEEYFLDDYGLSSEDLAKLRDYYLE